MSITFNNGFGFGASNGDGNNPYGVGTWKLKMSVAESNTTGIIFAAQSFSSNNGPGYASGWSEIVNQQNGAGNFWEYVYLSSTEFSTPQTDLLVEGTISFDANDNQEAKGLTIIGDALVGTSSSPTLENSTSGENSGDYNLQLSFDAAADTVIVITAGVESGRYSGVPRNITSVNGLGLSWSLRKKYSDPSSVCGQQSEIWYAVNNTGNAVSGTITIIYDTNFDDQAAVITSWLGCNLSSPWTSSNSSTSNRNTSFPAPSPTPTPTPTPTPSPLPLSQFTPNGTPGSNGLITYLDYTTGINASNLLPDQSGTSNEFAYVGSNPYTSGVTGYTFTGTGSYAYDAGANASYYNLGFNQMSFEMWVKIPTIQGSMSLIAAGGNNSGGWALRLDSSGNSLNLVKYNIADQSVNLPSTLQSNTWYHIAALQGGTSLTFMVNGVIVGAVNNGATNNFSFPNGTINIGKDFYTGNNFAMTLGQLKVYDYCLNASDVTTEYNNTKSGFGY